MILVVGKPLDLVYRPEFVQALTVLGRVCRSATERSVSFSPPILVGGAVVEFDTAGAFVSGDFDFVTPADDPFIAALEEAGFVRDVRQGRLQRPGEWVHPRLLIGIDMVSGSLFDGRTERLRIRLVQVEGGELHIPPVEDMIADRMGQWEASNRLDRSMLEQARTMLLLAGSLDAAYLERRLDEETAGACTLASIFS